MNPGDYMDYQRQLIERRREAMWAQVDRFKRDAVNKSPELDSQPQGKRPDQVGFSLLMFAFASITLAGLFLSLLVALALNAMGWIKL